MDFNTFIQTAHEQTADLLDRITERDRQGKGWVCSCGNGTGTTGDGLKLYEGHKLKCFKCNFSGDIIDYIGYAYNLSERIDQLKSIASLMGVELEASKSSYNTQFNTQQNYTSKPATEPIKKEEQDYTALFTEAHKHIADTDYHRGLSQATLDRFNIGYIEAWKHPKAPAGVEPTPRLIIPTGKGSYIARDTRAEIPAEAKGYAKMKVGSVQIFNADALYNTTRPAIYITEGEIDALSLIDVGAEAIATGSASMTKRLLTMLKNKPPIAPLLITMDNDEAGAKATAELVAGLKELGIEYYEYNISKSLECKDCNEAYNKDKGIFTLSVMQGELSINALRNYDKDQYIKQNNTADYLDAFNAYIKEREGIPPIKTGYNELDKVLEGGLNEGLYIIGAVSSLGKTTLMLQIADQVAKAGTDVLYFTLEMSKNELIARSISRNTFNITIDRKLDKSLAKTTAGIISSYRYKNYSQAELDLIQQAQEKYKRDSANNLYIIEGVGNISVIDIGEAVRKHERLTGKAPVVFIDYMQILAPVDNKQDAKASMDYTVVELKRLSRDLHIPILTVSSFNRSGYGGKATTTDFKESGAIEYTADVLIGLWYNGADKREFDENEARSKNPREIEATIIKNRNGVAGKTIHFDYYPMFNYFEETDYHSFYNEGKVY